MRNSPSCCFCVVALGKRPTVCGRELTRVIPLLFVSFRSSSISRSELELRMVDSLSMSVLSGCLPLAELPLYNEN